MSAREWEHLCDVSKWTADNTHILFWIDSHVGGPCFLCSDVLYNRAKGLWEKEVDLWFCKNDYKESESDVSLHIWSNSCSIFHENSKVGYIVFPPVLTNCQITSYYKWQIAHYFYLCMFACTSVCVCVHIRASTSQSPNVHIFLHTARRISVRCAVRSWAMFRDQETS